MSMWTGIVFIAVSAIIAEAYRHHTKSKLSKTDQQAIAAINRRLDTLESDLRQRVETLERIVTDSREDLKRQFEQLDRTG